MQARPRLLVCMLLVTSLMLVFLHVTVAADEPLPSWHDGAAKRAIVDFVQRVTTPGGPDFMPVPERIATFDNDGTLWAEQPIYFQRRPPDAAVDGRRQRRPLHGPGAPH
jgi:hypothetical protein